MFTLLAKDENLVGTFYTDLCMGGDKFSFQQMSSRK